jgi:pimeloyl-ACP methyl ester carboxylesterase
MAYVKSHGVDIYYETYGEADKTVIFAHGMGGNAAIWHHQVPALVDQYKAIVFDHRYFARSRCGVDEFDVAKFPDDVMAIMDTESIDSAVFVCQSMGGWTGSQMAIDHAGRVDGLIMSHTPGIFVNKDVVLDRANVTAQVTQKPPRFGSFALADDFPEKKPVESLIYQQISAFNDIDNAAIARKIGEAAITTDTATLQSYDIPTLFVTANQDRIFPPSYLEALAKTLPGAGCVNLGDVGHSSYFESPAAFNQVMLRFLNALI